MEQSSRLHRPRAVDPSFAHLYTCALASPVFLNQFLVLRLCELRLRFRTRLRVMFADGDVYVILLSARDEIQSLTGHES